jgi:hypothetical protein
VKALLTGREYHGDQPELVASIDGSPMT